MCVRMEGYGTEGTCSDAEATPIAFVIVDDEITLGLLLRECFLGTRCDTGGVLAGLTTNRNVGDWFNPHPGDARVHWIEDTVVCKGADALAHLAPCAEIWVYQQDFSPYRQGIYLLFSLGRRSPCFTNESNPSFWSVAPVGTPSLSQPRAS